MALKDYDGIIKSLSPSPDKKDEAKGESTKFKIPTIETDKLLAYLKKTLGQNLYATKIKGHLDEEGIKFDKGILKIKSGGLFLPLDEETVIQNCIQLCFEEGKNKPKLPTVEAHVRRFFFQMWGAQQRQAMLELLKNFDSPLSPSERTLKNRINREFLKRAGMGFEDWIVIQSIGYGALYCLLFNDRHIERIRFLIITSVERGYQKSTFVRCLLSPFLSLLKKPEGAPLTITDKFMMYDFFNQIITYLEDIDRNKSQQIRDKISRALQSVTTDTEGTGNVKYLAAPKHTVNLNHVITTANTKTEELNMAIFEDPSRFGEIYLVKKLADALNYVGFTEDFQKQAKRKRLILRFVVLNIREILHDGVLPNKPPPCEVPEIKKRLERIGSKAVKAALCEVIFSDYFQNKYPEFNQEPLGAAVAGDQIFVTITDLINFAEENKIVKRGELDTQKMGYAIKNSRLIDRVNTKEGYLVKGRHRAGFNQQPQYGYFVKKIWRVSEGKELRQMKDFKFLDEE